MRAAAATQAARLMWSSGRGWSGGGTATRPVEDDLRALGTLGELALFAIRPDEWRGRGADKDAPILPLSLPGRLAVDYVGLDPGDGRSRT